MIVDSDIKWQQLGLYSAKATWLYAMALLVLLQEIVLELFDFIK